MKSSMFEGLLNLPVWRAYLRDPQTHRHFLLAACAGLALGSAITFSRALRLERVLEKKYGAIIRCDAHEGQVSVGNLNREAPFHKGSERANTI